MALPNVIIAGPPKTGTTSIFHWLSQHPEVCASKVKETQFFLHHVTQTNSEANMLNHGLDAYEELFDHCEKAKVIIEATPDYIFSDFALEHISELHSKPMIVFVERDTAERLFSEYRFLRFKQRKINISFKEYCGFDGESFHGERVERGRINRRIKLWKERLGKDRIIVVSFDILKTNAQAFMRDLCQRLKIDPTFFDQFSFETKNETVAIKNSALHSLGLKVKKWMPHGVFKAASKFYFKINGTTLPQMTQEERVIIEKLREHYKNLGELTIDVK